MPGTILTRNQASKLGAMGGDYLAAKLKLKPKQAEALSKAGGWAAGKLGKYAGKAVTGLVGYKAGGVIVLKTAPKKKRGRKSKK